MIVTDTSVWIDFFKGKGSRGRALSHLIEDEEDIAITEIILTEILQGIRKEKDYEEVKKYLLEFPIYKPKGVQTYLSAAKIYRDCRKKGKTVRKTVDCIISAICIENNLTLFHKDKDFEQIASVAPLKCYNASHAGR